MPSFALGSARKQGLPYFGPKYNVNDILLSSDTTPLFLGAVRIYSQQFSPDDFTGQKHHQKAKRFGLFTSFDIYLICAELKQLQKLKAVRELLGHLIRLPSPAVCPAHTVLLPGLLSGLFLSGPGVKCAASSLGRQFHSQTLCTIKFHCTTFHLKNSFFIIIISCHYFYLCCLYLTNSKG